MPQRRSPCVPERAAARTEFRWQSTAETAFRDPGFMPRFPLNRQDRLPLNRLAGAFPWLPSLEIGPGWAGLVWDMAEDIEDLIGRSELLRGHTFRVERVKSKFGDLRVYYIGSAGSEEAAQRMEDIVGRAVLRSGRTCERCGRHGTFGLHSGWWSTLCMEHHEAEGHWR